MACEVSRVVSRDLPGGSVGSRGRLPVLAVLLIVAAGCSEQAGAPRGGLGEAALSEAALADTDAMQASTAGPELRTEPPEAWWASARRLAASRRASMSAVPVSDTVVVEFEEDAEAVRREAEWKARRTDSVRVAQTGKDMKGALFWRRLRRDESAEEAVEFLERERREQRGTVPYGVTPQGFLDWTGAGLGILYSSADGPVDEVRVLPETVLVRDGVLRGLVRNWSRTLWAYGVTVAAEGRVWHWPLTVQPGETAPFEIGEWDGPADPADIGFDVDAEMSNDADMTRDVYIRVPAAFLGGIIKGDDFDYYLPPEISAELEPEDAVILYVLVGGMTGSAFGGGLVVSHPDSVHYWELPENTVAWSAWVAWVPHGQTRVVEIEQLTLFLTRGASYGDDENDAPRGPRVLTARPHPELPGSGFKPLVAFDPTAPSALGTQTGHIVWAGMPHPPAADS